ncbi:MAG: DMT family transporter [Pseudoclavibacter sp.]|nr:DMT family transporter [Pseudoclavibacter sp.]
MLDLAAEAATGLRPAQLLGIPLALAGAVLMSIGALYQHRGVTKVEEASGSKAVSGLSARQLGRLVSRPSWVVGTTLLCLAVVLQLASLAFAPLIVVQPLGVASLVLTTLLTARITGIPLRRNKRLAVGLCVGGVGAFVTTAGFVAAEAPVTDARIVVVLVVLGFVVCALIALFAALRRRFKALFFIMSAGVVYGFVATLSKIIITRFQQGEADALTFVCLAAAIGGTAVGAYCVQTAYASGPPDLVVAGLTVIDPIVAVVIGIAVLGEADHAPWYVLPVFLVTGALAVWGVFLLERGQTAQEIERARAHALSRGRSARGCSAEDTR